MPRSRRWFRWSLVVVALFGVAAGAVKYYLGSKHVADKVASRLESVCGGPVGVAEAEIGFDGTILRGLQFFEAGSVLTTPPWAVIDEAQGDVSLWSVLSGDSSPSRVTLTGAIITLQFDADGHLLTRIPTPADSSKALPDIDIRQGQITLKQEGRPDLVVNNINAALHAAAGELVFDGAVNDPRWREWIATGTATWPLTSGSVTLKTVRPIHVTQADLNCVPFVPLKTWQHVAVEGDTDAEITWHYEAGDSPMHYRIVLNPRNTRVHVVKIDLHADQAHGQVVIEDKVVHLRGVEGRTADGLVATEADLDYRQRPYQLQFDIKGDNLDVQKLPKKWHLPGLLSGRMTGRTDLHLTLGLDQDRVTGEGQGELSHARMAGVPTKNMRLRLVNDGSGFKFFPIDADKPSAKGKNASTP